MHDICPWFLTDSHFRVFFVLFWRETGYAAINAQLPYIYGGMNNNVFDQFWWNLIVKVKMKGIMVGL